jgi:hypothetical protein
MVRKHNFLQNKFKSAVFVCFAGSLACAGAYVLFLSSAASIVGDLNNDNVVDLLDLSILLSHWDQTGSGLSQDLNNNGSVDIYDLSILLKNYGNTANGSLAPVNSALPVISGSTIQGRVLTAANGTWTNSPTNYSYAWQDCDSFGNNCTRISGAANWSKRADAGSPAYNGKWSTANITGPDSNGYVTLHLTNPTGSSPVSAEFDSTRQGFGYGTYTTVAAARLDTMNKALVFGCLFTYDDLTPHASHNEIDVCETSAWDQPRNPVTLEHTYYTDSSGGGGIVDATPVPPDTVLTHRMVWAPGKITWDSYIGTGTNGTLIKHTERTSSIPIPYKESVVFNLWAFDNAAANAAPFDVVIRDFSFVPAQ